MKLLTTINARASNAVEVVFDDVQDQNRTKNIKINRSKYDNIHVERNYIVIILKL